MTPPDRQPALGEASGASIALASNILAEIKETLGPENAVAVSTRIYAIAESALADLRSELSAERTRREDVEKKSVHLEARLIEEREWRQDAERGLEAVREYLSEWRQRLDKTGPDYTIEGGGYIPEETISELEDLTALPLALTEPTAAEEGKGTT
jgi:hypothetical protein